MCFAVRSWLSSARDKSTKDKQKSYFDDSSDDEAPGPPPGDTGSAPTAVDDVDPLDAFMAGAAL